MTLLGRNTIDELYRKDQPIPDVASSSSILRPPSVHDLAASSSQPSFASTFDGDDTDFNQPTFVIFAKIDIKNTTTFFRGENIILCILLEHVDL